MEGGKESPASAAVAAKDQHHGSSHGSETQIKLESPTRSSSLVPDHEDPSSPPFKVPPGYRFCPNDEELIVEYLDPKVQNKPLPYNNINDVILYNYNPKDLTEQYKSSANGENEWYFFTPRDKKYKNGSRPNRAAGNGYWKATGADKPIFSNCKAVGVRKALVFYEGKPPKGDKTNWIMHEFRINDDTSRKRDNNSMRLDDWVLCRIYQKNTDKSPKGSPKSHLRHDSDEREVTEEFQYEANIGTPENFDCVGMAAPLPIESVGFWNFSGDYELSSYSPLIPPSDSDMCDPCGAFLNSSWMDGGPVDSLLMPEPLASEPPHVMMMSKYHLRPQTMKMEGDLQFYSDNYGLQSGIFSRNSLPPPEESDIFSRNTLPPPDLSIKDDDHVNGFQSDIFSRNTLPLPDLSVEHDYHGNDLVQMNELFKHQATLSKRHRSK